jgi:hypothetical protein
MKTTETIPEAIERLTRQSSELRDEREAERAKRQTKDVKERVTWLSNRIEAIERSKEILSD